MRTLFLDLGMGAAGDMLAAALYELLDEEGRQEFVKTVSRLGIPDVSFDAQKATKCGITGTRMIVTVAGKEESEDLHANHHADHHCSHHAEHHADHHCDHHADHEHCHTSLLDVENIIDEMDVSDKVSKDIFNVYKIIADAESAVHGVPVTQIHFHEVGTKDAIADVAAVCILMEMLAPSKVVASPVHVGSGHVHCAHGILPVPAPATANILTGIPIYSSDIEGELCTPTGAALLKYFVDEFGEMPVMSVKKIGYGMGKKDFKAANCVRAMIGESKGKTADSTYEASLTDEENDEIVELTCNLDDMTAEHIGFAMDKLFDAGAVDVCAIPAAMKKSRPGIILSVMCSKDKTDEVVRTLFAHTTTIGIREQVCKRYILKRSVEAVQTEYGPVRLKKSEGYGVVRMKYEYDDLARIASENDMNIDEVVRRVEKRQ